MKHIPLVDLQGSLDADAPLARHNARALFEALSQIGFAYIAGHTVAPATRDAAFAASRAFHASTLAQKQSLAGLPMQGPNQWPDWLPGFKPAMLAYVREVDALGRHIVRLIALALGLPATALDHHFDHPTTFLRALHYPPQPPAEDEQMGSAPHTDYGIITLLAQDDSGGLQVRPRGGDWIEAPPIPDTYVLNVGDMLARWTNGRLVSTPHRVINRSGGDRYSLPYFLDPSMDTRIECLPTCTDADHPPQHPPVRYGDYLLERLNRNYDYRKPAAPAAAA